jgi:hypothetical protein
LERSIAITRASGRPYLLLAVAYQRLGRPEEARQLRQKGLPCGSARRRSTSPTENASPFFLEASERLIRTMVEVGLPES